MQQTVVSRAKAYLKVRHKSVRDAMKALKIDGLLLTHPPDLAYLTNFTGDDSIGLVADKDILQRILYGFEDRQVRAAGRVVRVCWLERAGNARAREGTI